MTRRTHAINTLPMLFNHQLCRLLRLLESAVNPKVNGRTMYFSYTADITQTTQRAAALAASKEEASKPLALRADPRFFWNKALLAPLLGRLML